MYLPFYNLSKITSENAGSWSKPELYNTENTNLPGLAIFNRFSFPYFTSHFYFASHIMHFGATGLGEDNKSFFSILESKHLFFILYT